MATDQKSFEGQFRSLLSGGSSEEVPRDPTELAQLAEAVDQVDCVPRTAADGAGFLKMEAD